MKTFALFLIAALGFGACAGSAGSLKDNPADPAEAKTISLQIRNKTAWTWSVTAEGVRGNGVSLQREADVIFGYLGEEQVRFVLGATTLDAGKSSLSLQRDENGVRLDGIAEEILLKASLDDAGIRLANPSMALELRQAAADEAQLTLVDAKDELRLIFRHCRPELVKTRPELLLVLAKQVLPVAYASLVQ